MSSDTDYGALRELPAPRLTGIDPRRFHKVGDNVEMPREMAAGHPLYGIAGWAVVLAVFMCLDAIMGVLIIIGSFVLASRGTGGLHALFGFIQFGLLCWAIVCLVKLFSKRPDFPGQYTAFCITSGALTLLGAMINGLSWVAAVQLAVVAIYIAYVQTSRRIRVTFRHQVGVNDAYLGKLFPEGLPDHLKPAVSPWSSIGKLPAPDNPGVAAARRPF